MVTFQATVPNDILAEGELASMVARHRDLPAQIAHGEACYAGSLGWLDPDEWAGEASVRELVQTAQRIRAQADAFVLIGVGGSNNAARAAIEAFQEPGTPTLVYMGHTLSAHALGKAIASLQGRSVYLDCIAKNFATLEPGLSFRLLRSFLDARYGELAPSRIVATGTPGGDLARLSAENGWQFFPFPQNIGGRFSALSAVGLLPMAVAGVDIQLMVEGAKAMRKTLLSTPPEANPALRYACLRNLLYQKGYRLEMLAAFEPQFRFFNKWWVQLFAESEGKDGLGLFPVTAEYSEDLHSVGQYVQDGTAQLLETFLRVRTAGTRTPIPPSAVDDGFAYLNQATLETINQAAFAATFTAHSQRLPCAILEVERLDAGHFGALFYFFEVACYLSGSILGINPFDQPGVEAYKTLMFEALERDGNHR